LNGTSKDDLLAGYRKAIEALDAMKEIAPNGRDYYPKGPDAILEAKEDHSYRLKKILEVKRQIESIAVKVSDQ
jgi:hypothetical protein